MGSWERVCDTASLVYAKWVQRARGRGIERRGIERLPGGEIGMAGCAGGVGCCWVPAGDAGMTSAPRARDEG